MKQHSDKAPTHAPFHGKELVLWVDPEAHIASFHQIPQGERMEFFEDEPYLSYLAGLIAGQYRFQ